MNWTKISKILLGDAVYAGRTACGVTVYWFMPSGHRCNYVKYAFLSHARVNAIKMIQLPLELAGDFGWSDLAVPALQSGRIESVVYLIVEVDGRRIRVILDAADSCYSVCPEIVSADLYFHNAYNSDFMVGRQWIHPYPWQQRADLSRYKQRGVQIIQTLGEHFSKLRKFIPMPMVMGGDEKSGYSEWHDRYRALLTLRKCRLKYDIVARDTLWAWPQHRLKMHQALQYLSGHRNIHARLDPLCTNPGVINWDVASEGEKAGLDRQYANLPRSGDLREPYEEALASSRLNVFACGKHWGWRQVMMVSLLAGTPILMDRPLYEPYFDFSEFKLFYTANEWEEVADILSKITDEEWRKIRCHNQEVFDRRLSPSAVCEYVVKTAKNEVKA